MHVDFLARSRLSFTHWEISIHLGFQTIEPDMIEIPSIPFSKLSSSQGMNAFVNGELGMVKYVGRVEFSEGIWVGIHLKNPSE